MARRIGDDKFSTLCGEGTISNIDRDALLALGRKPVHQEREIERSALRPDPPGIGFEGLQVILEDQLRFIEQPPDQRRLAVIDAAAGDEAQQVLALLEREIVGDRGRRGIEPSHQK